MVGKPLQMTLYNMTQMSCYAKRNMTRGSWISCHEP